MEQNLTPAKTARNETITLQNWLSQDDSLVELDEAGTDSELQKICNELSLFLSGDSIIIPIFPLWA